MSNFKKGDLVEIVKTFNYPELLGERFILGEVEFWENSEVFMWATPFKGDGGSDIYTSEIQLKKINPDTDEKSNFTFEELMDKMKSQQLEGVE